MLSSEDIFLVEQQLNNNNNWTPSKNYTDNSGGTLNKCQNNWTRTTGTIAASICFKIVCCILYLFLDIIAIYFLLLTVLWRSTPHYYQVVLNAKTLVHIYRIRNRYLSPLKNGVIILKSLNYEFLKKTAEGK